MKQLAIIPMLCLSIIFSSMASTPSEGYKRSALSLEDYKMVKYSLLPHEIESESYDSENGIFELRLFHGMILEARSTNGGGGG
ncbi:MAG: hypothetical protein HOE90_08655 [Bacteriovoracaceae bacterium]|jgi:hypothetical protein|nr:hypothetical protein [Bacteriovoracaceae bacterium]